MRVKQSDAPFGVEVFPDKEQILQFDEMPTPILPEKDMI